MVHDACSITGTRRWKLLWRDINSQFRDLSVQPVSALIMNRLPLSNSKVEVTFKVRTVGAMPGHNSRGGLKAQREENVVIGTALIQRRGNSDKDTDPLTISRA